MATRVTKEEFFRRAFEAGQTATEFFDLYFLGYPNNVEDSSMLRVFGTDFIDGPGEYDGELARSEFRKTPFWQCFNALYDYVTEGVLPDRNTSEDIIAWSTEAIKIIPSEQTEFRSVAEPIMSAMLGRSALDDGEDVELSQLANLANVDDRSVRNAVSIGELIAMSGKPVFIDNQSARAWLLKRRGYRPTQIPSDSSSSFADVKSPAEFGAFLKAQYKCLYPEADKKLQFTDHPAIGERTMELLEAGVFNLPLDVCPYLADFYQIGRPTFLLTVMKAFYEDELRQLTREMSCNGSSEDD